jgi:hypothetical protein
MQPLRDQTKTVLDRGVLEAEVERIVAAGAAAGVTVRAVGSLAVSIHCPASAALLPAFARTYADIDLVGERREARSLATVLSSLGYVEDREIFITSEGYRAIFQGGVTGIHVDVFFDRLEFCHTIPISGRLAVDRLTVPLAELLLTKLQIVRINAKDVVDAALLLLEHPPGTGDRETIDIRRIASLCAAEWGLWRTLSMNLEKLDNLVAGFDQLSIDQRALIRDRAAAIRAAIDAIPKPLAWRVRARVGDHRQWWNDVDEVL